MNFTYTLASDLHYDFPQQKIHNWPDHQIIVAGDSSNGLVGLKPLNKLKNKGHKVFAIDGNHEHYSNDAQGRSIVETEDAFYKGLNQTRRETVADGLTLLGCNGWYLVKNSMWWVQNMNDGRFCGSDQDVNRQAQDHAAWLDFELASLSGKAIVVTHTAPTEATLNPKFDGHFSNEWYWNPLMGEVLRRHADKILAWNHGHSHAPADKVVDGVRVICNPRGYPGENPAWSPMEVTVSY